MALRNKHVKSWIRNGLYFRNLKYKYDINKAKEIENNFGNHILRRYYDYNYNNCNWSGILGECLVKSLLENSGNNVIRPRKNNNLLPDWETDDYIYEVKARKYTSTGSIGEKILGVPYKYADIPILYKKPLKIVLIGYQEYEAINKFDLFDPSSDNKQNINNMLKNMGIEFVKGSDLL